MQYVFRAKVWPAAPPPCPPPPPNNFPSACPSELKIPPIPPPPLGVSGTSPCGVLSAGGRICGRGSGVGTDGCEGVWGAMTFGGRVVGGRAGGSGTSFVSGGGVISFGCGAGVGRGTGVFGSGAGRGSGTSSVFVSGSGTVAISFDRSVRLSSGAPALLLLKRLSLAATSLKASALSP